MADQFSFEKLEVYQQALVLVKKVYSATESFPSHEKFGLYSQIHRSIVSVPSNIAESCGRVSYKEKIHFLEIAYGSLLESYCQLQIACNIGYIIPSVYKQIQPAYFDISRMLTALTKSYVKLLNS